VLSITITVALFGIATASAAPDHWSIAHAPHPGSTSILNSVEMTKSHGWAVGMQQTAGGVTKSLIERASRDGRSWSVMPMPGNGREGLELFGVDGGDSDAWAVGSGDNQAVALHWKGKVWSSTAVPKVRGGYLSGVAVRSAKDVWAVGSRAKNERSVPWTVHWNGSRWRTVDTPNPGKATNGLPATAFLTDVTALPGSPKLLAVGDKNAYGRGAGEGYAQEWKSGHWSTVNIQGAPDGSYYLSAITATSAKSAWAVGSTEDGTQSGTLTLHWNGATWNPKRAPHASDGELEDVSAAGANSIWAVGSFPNSDEWSRPLIVHWNGESWDLQNPQSAGHGKSAKCQQSNQGLLGVGAEPGGSQTVAVGYEDTTGCNLSRQLLLERDQ
jgi:hypothetical protein